ncbi:CoA transferase [Mycobacterium timonense]|uniref:CoA transferase n=1 Tax=Mycobacterium timonense TaxID=701043 RepID=UPI0013D23CA6
MTVTDCLFLPHANKRGVVLDVTTKEGRAELLSLVDRADTVVESLSPEGCPTWVSVPRSCGSAARYWSWSPSPPSGTATPTRSDRGPSTSARDC